MVVKCKMQRIPKPGQLIVSVELTALKHHTIDEAVEKLQQLGYTVELRYLETLTGLEIHAVLLDEQHDPTREIDKFYRVDETIALFEAFPSDEMSIHSSRGVPSHQPVAA